MVMAVFSALMPLLALDATLVTSISVSAVILVIISMLAVSVSSVLAIVINVMLMDAMFSRLQPARLPSELTDRTCQQYAIQVANHVQTQIPNSATPVFQVSHC